jgi:hypothetical protein
METGGVVGGAGCCCDWPPPQPLIKRDRQRKEKHQ